MFRAGINSKCSFGFRPLTGILFFNSSPSLFLMLRRSPSVSVPLRGFCFSTRKEMKKSYTGPARFPSPYGDFVFQLAAAQRGMYALGQIVSVPLRGFCFSTRKMKMTYIMISESFRPLTGILFFNACKDCTDVMKYTEFPSPYGDFVFQPGSCWANNRSLAESFRPLTGILFFNAISQRYGENILFERFPSPYGDFVFQHCSTYHWNWSKVR